MIDDVGGGMKTAEEMARERVELDAHFAAEKAYYAELVEVVRAGSDPYAVPVPVPPFPDYEFDDQEVIINRVRLFVERPNAWNDPELEHPLETVTITIEEALVSVEEWIRHWAQFEDATHDELEALVEVIGFEGCDYTPETLDYFAAHEDVRVREAVEVVRYQQEVAVASCYGEDWESIPMTAAVRAQKASWYSAISAEGDAGRK